MTRDKAAVRFKDALMSARGVDSFEEAREGWHIKRCFSSPIPQACLCGRKSHKLWGVLEHEQSGTVVYPVGIACLDFLEDASVSLDAKCWQQTYRLLDAVCENGKGSVLKIDDSCFTRDLIMFFGRQGVFVDAEYNDFDGSGDAELMLAAFNSRSEQLYLRSHANGLVRLAVYPWLRLLYRDNRLLENGADIYDLAFMPAADEMDVCEMHDEIDDAS